MTKASLALVFILMLVCSNSPLSAIRNEELSALAPRSIGPANMSGRLTAIAVSPKNPDIIYIGSATGGLWKTENGGNTWTPLFDAEKSSSIGDVAIDPRNPNIIWVGTGEANPRNSVGVGRGVYKSLDAGRTWTCLGLEATEKISRIQINPLDTDIVYVGALGTTWSESEHRGVYKTRDGGKSWQKVKYIGKLTGVADLAMDPSNPNHLLAAFWEHQRWPWFFRSGGKESGLFATWDGGVTWQRQEPADGFIDGPLGRIGIAFAPGMPQVVYALVEAKKNTLLRSQNGGRNWQIVNQNPGLGGRPFYYCDIRVNPKNENILYSLESGILTSEDGGKSFRSLANWTQSHPDYHAMWIAPDGQQLIIGNDGGLVISRDRGKTFTFVSNLPLGQYYHVSFDMEFPYRVYGGLQDNGSWKGPSTVLTDRAIYPAYWTMLGFGDGFDVEPDPEDSNCGYAMSQGGALYYYNTRTGRRLSIRPTPGEVKDRYSWNAALALDPFHPKTIYYGSQVVHRSPDKGLTWEIISPDLTTNDPRKQQQHRSGGLTPDVTDAENHTTIICIAPSPIQEGLIWVSTDDGNIQLTRDGGKTWHLVSLPLTGTDPLKSRQRPPSAMNHDQAVDLAESPSLLDETVTSSTRNTPRPPSEHLLAPMPLPPQRVKKGPVPHGSSAAYVEPSRFDPAVAYVVYEDHQRSNWTHYVFVTRDFGRKWHSLATEEIDGFCHVVKQDLKNPKLLFLGTEFGLFYTLNEGKSWSKWTSGFPTVPVREMQIHPREDDLIIATHGRALYIMDRITPLRELSDEVLRKNLHLFELSPAHLIQPGWGGTFVAPGDGVFAGQNRPNGVFIDYIYNPIPGQEKPTPFVKIEISDDRGEVIRTLKPESKPGLNRLIWDMRQKSLDKPVSESAQHGDPPGLLVLPGFYTVTMTLGDVKVFRQVEIKPDPRLPFDEAKARQNHAEAREIQLKSSLGFNLYKDLKKHLETLNNIRPFVARRAAEDVEAQKLLERLAAVGGRISGLIDRMMPLERGKGIPHRPDTISSMLFEGSDSIFDNFADIPQHARVKVQRALKEMEAWQKEVQGLISNDIRELEDTFHQNKIPLFSSDEEEKSPKM